MQVFSPRSQRQRERRRIAHVRTPNGQTSAARTPAPPDARVPGHDGLSSLDGEHPAAGASTVPTARGHTCSSPPKDKLASGERWRARWSSWPEPWSRLGSRGSDAWADAVRVVVRRSFGRSACGRTPVKPAAFALTLRAPEDDPQRSSGVSPARAPSVANSSPHVQGAARGRP
jgi:hypothetical protein